MVEWLGGMQGATPKWSVLQFMIIPRSSSSNLANGW